MSDAGTASDAGTVSDGGVGSDGGLPGGTFKFGKLSVNQGSLMGSFDYDLSAAFVTGTPSPAPPVNCPGQVNVASGGCLAAVICDNSPSDAGTPTLPVFTELNAGAITFAGGSLGAAPTTLTFGPVVGSRPPRMGYTPARGMTQIFAGGDQLTVSGAGGADLPAFAAQTLVAPSDITLTSPSCASGCPALDRTADLQVAWTGGGAGKVFITYETLSAAYVAIVSCSFNAADGMGTVPASFLAHLEKAGDPGISGVFAAGVTNEGPPFLVGDIATTFEIQGSGVSGGLTVSK